MSTPKSVIELAKKSGAKMVDIKFVDTFGTWQHFSCPIRELTEDIFTEGLGFDGSSIRGWKSIEASDMLAMPDPVTAFIDPFCAVPTLSLTCTIAETGTLEPYTRDPRGIAQRAEQHLISTGIADQAFFGPEAEFFIFDNVRFDSKSNGTFYSDRIPVASPSAPSNISFPPASPIRRFSVPKLNSSSSTTFDSIPRAMARSTQIGSPSHRPARRATSHFHRHRRSGVFRSRS